jgi:hypothetical protein
MQSDREQAGLQQPVKCNLAARSNTFDKRPVLLDKGAPGNVNVGYMSPVTLRCLPLFAGLGEGVVEDSAAGVWGKS